MGRLYISDSNAGRILVRDEQGRLVSTKRGLRSPLGLAVNPQGLIYVAEKGTGSVSVFLPNWSLLGKLGKGDGEFILPNHIALDPNGAGRVFVSDSAAHLVKVFDPSGRKIAEFGGFGTAPGFFDFPTGIHVDRTGEIFIADQNNGRIQVFDAGLQYLRSFGKLGGMLGGSMFGRLQGILGDGQGRLYLADAFHGEIRVFDTQGTAISTIGSFGDGPGELSRPVGLAIDRNNRLLVVSSGNTRVDFFGLDGYSDPWILPALVSLRPASLEREVGNDPQSKILTVLLRIPGADPGQILAASVRANGVPALAPTSAAVGDWDGDGALALKLRFDRRRLLATLPDGRGLMTLSGRTGGGAPFEGTANVTVAPAREGLAGEGGSAPSSLAEAQEGGPR
jgi:sugar lactone lactonase YvrE